MKGFKVIKKLAIFLLALVMAAAAFACGPEPEPEPPAQGTLAREDLSAAESLLNLFPSFVNAQSLIDATAAVAVRVPSENTDGEFCDSTGLPVRQYSIPDKIGYAAETATRVLTTLKSRLGETRHAMAAGKWTNFETPDRAPVLANKGYKYNLGYQTGEDFSYAEFKAVNFTMSKGWYHFLSVRSEGSVLTAEGRIDDNTYIKYVVGKSLTLVYGGKLTELTFTNNGNLSCYEYDALSANTDGRLKRITGIVYGSRRDGFYELSDGTDLSGAKVSFYKDGYRIYEYYSRDSFTISLYALSGWYNMPYTLAKSAHEPNYGISGEVYKDTYTTDRAYTASTLRIVGTDFADIQPEDLVLTASGKDIEGKFDGLDLIFSHRNLLSNNRASEKTERQELIEEVFYNTTLSFGANGTGTLEHALTTVKDCLFDTAPSNAYYRIMSVGQNSIAAKALRAFGYLDESEGMEITNEEIPGWKSVPIFFDGKISGLLAARTAVAAESAQNNVLRWDYAGTIGITTDKFLFDPSYTDGSIIFTLPATKPTAETAGVSAGAVLKYQAGLTDLAGKFILVKDIGLDSAAVTITKQELFVSAGITAENASAYKGGGYFLTLRLLSGATVLSQKLIGGVSGAAFAEYAEAGGYGFNVYCVPDGGNNYLNTFLRIEAAGQ